MAFLLFESMDSIRSGQGAQSVFSHADHETNSSESVPNPRSARRSDPIQKMNRSDVPFRQPDPARMRQTFDISYGIRPAIDALPNSLIGDVANYGRGRDGMIPLWFGEGDVPTPPFIIDAAAQAMRQGHVFYTWLRGYPELRAALAGWLGRVHGTGVDAERVTITQSGMEAIMLSLQTLIDPGDEIVMVTPVWPNAASAAAILGGVVRPVPLTLGERGWTLDLDRLFDACGPRTRMMFINSPNNPTGWTLEREEMRRILDFTRSRGLWLLSDEVYARIVYDAPAAPSFLEFADSDDRLLVVGSFSKNWSMTGWRMGWVVAPPALGATYEKMIQFNYSGVPGFIQQAGIAALNQGEPFLAEMVARCHTGRDIVCDALEALPRVRLHRPEGAFYAFFAVDGAGDSATLARRIIDEANVGLAPGAAFGEGGEGYLRLCFASSPGRLEQAMDRLTPVLR
jgi:aspartate aminotransferase